MAFLGSSSASCIPVTSWGLGLSEDSLAYLCAPGLWRLQMGLDQVGLSGHLSLCVAFAHGLSSLVASGEPMKMWFCFLKKNLFISLVLWAGSLLLPGLFSNCHKCGLLLSCSARASHCSGFSCWGAQAVGAWASIAAPHGLNSFGTWA